MGRIMIKRYVMISMIVLLIWVMFLGITRIFDYTHAMQYSVAVYILEMIVLSLIIIIAVANLIKYKMLKNKYFFFKFWVFCGLTVFQFVVVFILSLNPQNTSFNQASWGKFLNSIMGIYLALTFGLMYLGQNKQNILTGRFFQFSISVILLAIFMAFIIMAKELSVIPASFQMAVSFGTVLMTGILAYLLWRKKKFTDEIRNEIILFLFLLSAYNLFIAFPDKSEIQQLLSHIFKIPIFTLVVVGYVYQTKETVEKSRGERDRYKGLFHTALTRSEFLDVHNQRLEAILNSSNLVMVISTDEKGIITSFNTGAEKMTGYSQKEVLGVMTPFQFIQLFEGESTHSFETILTKIKQTGNLRKECTLQTSYGEKRYLDLTISVFTKEPVNKTGLFFIGVDVTEKKAAKKELKESRERYKRLIDYSPTGIIVHVEGIIRYCNQAAYKILEAKNSEEILGKSIFDFVSPEYENLVRERLNHLSQGAAAVEIHEEKLKRLNGELFCAQVLGTSVEYNGEPAVQVVFMDVSKKKKLEKEFVLRNQALEEASQAVLFTDAEGVVTWVNKGFSELTGYAVDELLGKKLNILKSGMMPDQFYRKFWEIISSGHSWHGEFINRRKNGEIYTQLTSVSSVKNDDNKIFGYICLASDITKNKRAELSLHLREKRFSTIFHQFNQGIMILRLEENSENIKIVAVNNAGALQLRKVTHELVGKEISDINSSWMSKSFYTACREVIKNDSIEIHVYKFRDELGKEKTRSSKIMRVFGNELAVFFKDS